jgi:LemA protein
MILWILIGVIVLLALFFMLYYNSFVNLKNQAENAWSQIDVQLKRRNDLIPNLIETVKGYAKHEKSVFENVTKARTSIMKAGNLEQKAKADNMMTETLKSLFAVAENYPKLQANQNFLQLQEELSGTESKIAYARQFYNDTVMTFNTKIESFPGTALAGPFGFVKKELFKAPEAERKNVKVKF